MIASALPFFYPLLLLKVYVNRKDRYAKGDTDNERTTKEINFKNLNKY